VKRESLVHDRTTEMIALPTPTIGGGRSLDWTLAARRSVREYRHAALAPRELGQLLWAAQGFTSGDGLRAAPSAGALYPLEVYAVIGAVDDIPGGIYRYAARRHTIAPVVSGDHRAALAAAALGQECVAEAAAVIALAAVPARTTQKYGARGLRYVHMEVGHASQNICLQAVALDLGCVVVGAFDDATVKKVLRLGANEEPMCLLPVGRP
jgi:SagB-type dehydrogenase family enzyme